MAAILPHGQDASRAFVADCRPQVRGMSTTVTALASTDDGRVLVVNDGDLEDRADTGRSRVDNRALDRSHGSSARSVSSACRWWNLDRWIGSSARIPTSRRSDRHDPIVPPRKLHP
jgi:hypothetical protein